MWQSHHHESSAYLASDGFTEQLIFLGIFFVWQWIEPLVVQSLDGIFQMPGTACQQDCIIEVVHSQLGYSSIQSHSFCIREQGSFLLQVEDDQFCIGKSFQTVTFVFFLMHDGVFPGAIEVSLGIGGDDSLSL